uniref:BPTI/Kunitz inhibitor domain-containing protein n=1 Tax=Chrysemys picta bellii TaxID=8478 RepID=A0A8C3IU00_CHRPI
SVIDCGPRSLSSTEWLCSAFQTLLSLLCSSDLCRLPADPGSCYAMIPRWFYNWQAKKCEQFTYGGCDGNKNNFATQTECLGKCGGHGELGAGPAGPSSFPGPPDIQFRVHVQSFVPFLYRSEGHCQLCRVGPCTAAIPRWGYNWHSKKCEEFSYGGCNGNKNNFETKVDCLQACAGQVGMEHRILGQEQTLRGRLVQSPTWNMQGTWTARAYLMCGDGECVCTCGGKGSPH